MNIAIFIHFIVISTFIGTLATRATSFSANATLILTNFFKSIVQFLNRLFQQPKMAIFFRSVKRMGFFHASSYQR